VVDFCGGEVSALGMAGEQPDPQLVIDFDPALIVKLTGLEVTAAETKRILTSLGFEIGGKSGALKVSVPSWRPDVHGPADLVEEVIRIVGIDTVPSVPMPRTVGVAKPVMTERQKRVRRARHLLAGRGLVEAVTYSFIQRDVAALFGGGGDAVELANPISSEMSSMRPSLLPGLLQAAQRNVDRALGDSALFEVGQVYGGDEPDEQTTSVAAVRTGGAGLTGSGRDWQGTEANVDGFDAKADAAAVLAGLGLDPSKVQITRSAPGWFHPGRSGTFQLGPKNVLGHFGEIHPAIVSALDLSRNAVAFEMTIENLPTPKKKSTTRGALDMVELQPVRRDFAFVVNADVAAGDLVRAAQGAEKKIITDVSVFDVFEGSSLGEGKKSLAIEVTMQPRGKTMTDEDIDAVVAKVVAQVKKATGGEIRG
ncbi:MAG: phenylalanine--tRNA ligase subunit beta, partial [Methyloligellaceae bacterium]